jgi:heme O synthase-like polyprenyltransferase
MTLSGAAVKIAFVALSALLLLGMLMWRPEEHRSFAMHLTSDYTECGVKERFDPVV